MVWLWFAVVVKACVVAVLILTLAQHRALIREVHEK